MTRHNDPMVLIPKLSFWRDGCASLARNTCEVLRLAGIKATASNMVRFVSSLPADATDLVDADWQKTSLCNECLGAAYERSLERGEDKRLRELMDYFLYQCVGLPSYVQYMLTEAFIGFIGNMALDRDEGKP